MAIKKSQKLNIEQRVLIAEHCSNIGVAWFSGGVVGVFITHPTNLVEIIISLSWGVTFGFLFLFLGVYLLKRKLR